MPTWPTSKAGTTHLDSGSDNPGSARADIKQNVDNVNDMIDTIVVNSPSANQVLAYDSGDSRFENIAVPAVTSVAGGTGLTGGTITATGTLAVDVGTTANKIVQLDGSAKLPAVDGSALTGIAAGAVSAVATVRTTTNPVNFPATTFTKVPDVSEQTDPEGIVSISTGVVTLAAGTYLIFIVCPDKTPTESSQNTYEMRLQDTTNTATLKTLQAKSGPDAEPWTDGFTTQTFGGSTNLEIQVRRGSTGSANVSSITFGVAFLKL